MTPAIIRTRGSSFSILRGHYRSILGEWKKQNGNYYCILGFYWDTGKMETALSILRLYCDATLK